MRHLVLISILVLSACGGDDDAGDASPAIDAGTDARSDAALVDAPIDAIDAGAEPDGATDVGAEDAAGDANAVDVGVDAPELSNMGFFVTAAGSGAPGGDLGGLEGADERCQNAATAAGAGTRIWRAYLSVEGPPVVNARARIGEGPWRNARGELVAMDVDSLHTDGIVPSLMFDENGMGLDDEIPGAGHDILTGSNEDGTVREGRTCADWSSSQRADRAQVGHHDWSDIVNPISPNQNWNSVHDTRCDEDSLIRTLGIGRIYCFASE